MRKETKRFYIQLSALLFLTGVVFLSLLWIGNNWNSIAGKINGIFSQEITYTEEIDGEYKTINVDACDANTTTKP